MSNDSVLLNIRLKGRRREKTPVADWSMFFAGISDCLAYQERKSTGNVGPQGASAARSGL